MALLSLTPLSATVPVAAVVLLLSAQQILLASGDLHVADTLAVVPAVIMVHGGATMLIASLKCS